MLLEEQIHIFVIGFLAGAVSVLVIALYKLNKLRKKLEKILEGL